MPRLTLVILMAMGCTPGQDDAYDEIRLHGVTAADPITRVDRLSTGEAFHPGDTEVFRAILRDPTTAQVTWSASAGELDADGDEVRWTLPYEAHATLTAHVLDASGATHAYPIDIELIAVSPAATGRISASDDPHGSFADLVIDSNDVPHVIYREDWHDQWRYAKFSGGVWTNELIDGPGFGVGDAAAFASPGIALDSNNVPHVVFVRSNGEVVYANRIGGTWTLTQLTFGGEPGNGASIVVDTANNNTPYMAWTDAATARTTMCKKSNGAFPTFTQGGLPAGASYGNYRGGLALSGNNAVRYTFGRYEAYTGTWSQANGFGNYRQYDTTYTYTETADRLVHVSANTYGVMNLNGLYWTTNNGSPFDYNFVVDPYIVARDVAYDGSQPRLAIGHDNTLELVRPDARGYWAYTTADTSISPGGGFAAALDTSGNLHVVYQKDGALWFF